MNVYLNLSNLTNNRDIFSIRMEILKKGYGDTKRTFFVKSIMSIGDRIFITDKFAFENDCEYIVIYSIVQSGKQISKKMLTFKYIECEEFSMEQLSLSKMKIIDNKKIKIINEIDYRCLNYYVTLNPLLVFRKLEEEYEIYLNGNLLFLKGNLYNIFEYILSTNDLNRIYTLVSIDEVAFSNYINTLIRKGCIIVYEK